MEKQAVASRNLEIIRGDDADQPIEIVSIDPETKIKTPIDLTGATVYFTIKNLNDSLTDDSEAIYSVDVTVHSDPTNGKTVIPIPRTNTATFAIKKYKYDIQYLKDGKIKSIKQGILEVLDDVTKRPG